MKVGTLRGRLVIAAAAAVLLAVALFGFAASALVASELGDASDRSLRARAGDVARLSASAPALLGSAGALDAASGGRQLDVEVLDARGRIVGRSLSLGARLLPRTGAVERALRDGRGGFDDARIGDRSVRLYAAPLAQAGGPAAGGAVIVASDVSDIDAIADRVRAVLLIAGAIAALLGAAVAAGLVGRALRPLRRLSTGAAQIERSADASQRLPAPGTDDEADELAAALNRMLDALQHAQDRERRLLADASHELRTPLTALAGNVEFLAAHGSTPELIADLQHDTVRLRRLVDDLLILEREGAMQSTTETVDLSALAEDTGAQPRLDVDATPGVIVAGEADALRRALGNLVENALIHGPAEGRVLVLVRATEAEATLAVTDEGPGLPRDAHSAAFERFWRGPDAQGRPGSGLGLAIVQATAARHGGSITVDGATITLHLPLYATSPPPATRPMRDTARR